jgi:hypothetical protein
LVRWCHRPPAGAASGPAASWLNPFRNCAVALLCSRVRLWHVPARLRSMSHRVCPPLLDPPRADMALHRDADMVWAVAGTCRVKFLSGFASGQGENTLAQARALRAGFASRRFALGCSWRPPAASRGNCGLCFCRGSRSGSPTRWRLADPRQHAFGGLEIGQLSGNLFAVGIEARKPLADLRLLCADLVQYRRCCGWHGDLQ